MRLAVLVAALTLAAVAPNAAAQRADSTRAGAKRPPAADTTRRQRRPPALALDTVRRPPITPKRAFLRSLMMPGWGQASLNRGAAGGVFVVIEGLSASMIYKSVQDLSRARRAAHDSIVVGFATDTVLQNGIQVQIPKLDSLGAPVPRFGANPLSVRVAARRQHVEDWVALLAFNHLFAAADAFVAAHLWDIPGGVAVRPLRRGAVVTAHFAW